MLQEMLSLLPPGVVKLPWWQPAAVAGMGALLGLVGARYSRRLVALAAVAGGTFLGLHAPSWFALKMDGIGAAFCTAIAVGVIGFLLHRVFIGLLQATLFGSLAGFGTWITRAGTTPWQIPRIDLNQSAPAILSVLRDSLPAQLHTALPVAIAIGWGLGIILAFFWPRFSQVTFFSLFGMTIMTVAGALALGQVRPDLLARVPTDPKIQLALFAGIVLLAMTIQRLLLPRNKRAAGRASAKDSANNTDHEESLIFPSPSLASGSFPIDQKRQETAARRQRAIATES